MGDEPIEKIKQHAEKVKTGVIETIKNNPKSFVLGLGAGVLLTGPFPGGLTIAVLGVGIIVGSLFMSSKN